MHVHMGLFMVDLVGILEDINVNMRWYTFAQNDKSLTSKLANVISSCNGSIKKKSISQSFSHSSIYLMKATITRWARNLNDFSLFGSFFNSRSGNLNKSNSKTAHCCAVLCWDALTTWLWLNSTFCLSRGAFEAQLTVSLSLSCENRLSHVVFFFFVNI